MTVRQRAYKYRFYPTDEQATQLARTFGCSRLVYNKALGHITTEWRDNQKRVSAYETVMLLPEWKNAEETEFLKEVSSVTLQQSIRNLATAFDNFFSKRAAYPKFKKRGRSKESAIYANTAFSFTPAPDGTAKIKLAKQSEPLNIVWSRPLPAEAVPSTITVSKDPSGRYFVSMLVKEDIDELPTAAHASVGFDLGLKDYAITSRGSKYPNPRHTKKYENKLALAQKRLAKKQSGSQNRAKAKLKVAKIHAKIADARRDHLHKLSTQLVRQNQTIICETLRVKNMVKNHSLAKAISDASWGEFINMIEYKAEWYGRTLVKIDQWYPSTQLCSTTGCEYRNQNLSLTDRYWSCPSCSVRHDRDVNAALNIEAAGLAVLACGDGVKPVHDPRGREKVTVREAGNSKRKQGFPRL